MDCVFVSHCATLVTQTFVLLKPHFQIPTNLKTRDMNPITPEQERLLRQPNDQLFNARSDRIRDLLTEYIDKGFFSLPEKRAEFVQLVTLEIGKGTNGCPVETLEKAATKTKLMIRKDDCVPWPLFFATLRACHIKRPCNLSMKVAQTMNEQCIICSLPFTENTGFSNNNLVAILKTCHHAFHLDCLISWLLRTNTCPLCRSNCYKRGFE